MGACEWQTVHQKPFCKPLFRNLLCRVHTRKIQRRQERKETAHSARPVETENSHKAGFVQVLSRTGTIPTAVQPGSAPLFLPHHSSGISCNLCGRKRCILRHHRTTLCRSTTPRPCLRRQGRAPDPQADPESADNRTD